MSKFKLTIEVDDSLDLSAIGAVVEAYLDLDGKNTILDTRNFLRFFHLLLGHFVSSEEDGEVPPYTNEIIHYGEDEARGFIRQLRIVADDTERHLIKASNQRQRKGEPNDDHH